MLNDIPSAKTALAAGNNNTRRAKATLIDIKRVILPNFTPSHPPVILNSPVISLIPTIL
jgi:hypothetical protein